MGITYQSAVLFVEDIARSRQFYEGVLGQTVDMDFGPNVGYKGGFAIWQIDAVNQVIFGAPDHVSAPLGHNNVELYFEADDLATVSETLARAGVPFVQPIHEQPWGQRALRVADPDGHIIEFAEPMPVVIKRMLEGGATVEAIAERSSMPLAEVQYIAEHGEFPAPAAAE